jgi:hypothetical protein
MTGCGRFRYRYEGDAHRGAVAERKSGIAL